ncbi:MAG: hypothetical protein ACRD96_12225 [Bryobacteraceae bacterium]
MGVNLREWAYPGGIPAPPAATPSGPPPFVPTYEKHSIKSALGGEWPINEFYFASAETADYLAKKFGAEVFTRRFGGDGGPFQASGVERWLRFPDGMEMNAGMLASYYTRNPEAQFPGYAERQIWEALGRARREGEGE